MRKDVRMAETDWRQEARDAWDALPGNARDTLIALCKHGPLWDGDVPSKAGRDELLSRKLAAKIVIKGNQQGYQAATYTGSRAYTYGFVERRQDVVRKLVGDPALVKDRKSW